MSTKGKDLHNLPPLKLERGAKLSLSRLLSGRPRTTLPTTSPWSPWTPSPWSVALRSASSLFFFHSLFFSILSWAFNKSDRHHPQQHRHHLQHHQNLHWQHFHPHHHPTLDYHINPQEPFEALSSTAPPSLPVQERWQVRQKILEYFPYNLILAIFTIVQGTFKQKSSRQGKNGVNETKLLSCFGTFCTNL